MAGVQVSDEDREFLRSLRERQRQVLAALDAPAAADDAGREDKRRAWEFDGAVVLGRLDDAAGRRRYVGSRRVAVGDEVLLHDIGDLEVAPLWSATREEPRGLVLKRRFRVEGWAVVTWNSEFDLRPAATVPSGTGRPSDGDPASKPAAVRRLHADKDELLLLLDSCRTAVGSGVRVADDAPMALRRWNDSLERVARLVATVGAPPVPPRLDSIEKALRDAEEFETVERARRLLRDRLAGIDALLVSTGARAEGAPRPGDDVLRDTRDRLQAELDALGTAPASPSDR